MADAPALKRYEPGLRRLHWLMALLVLAAYLFIEQRDLFPRGSGGRAGMLQAHFWVGLSLLALVLWRLRLRRRAVVPPISPPLPRWRSWPAKLLHVALYAFFIGMPLLGLATTWSDGKVLYIPFTQVALPALLPVDKPMAHWLEDLHGTIGEVFYWVIGAHVLAALYHHALRRDDTLRRML